MIMYMTVPIILLVQVFMSVFHAHIQCPLYKPLFIMDKYDTERSFYQLRRFLKDYVNILPDESQFHVIALDSKEIKPFSGKKIKPTWIESIGQSSTSNGIIEHKPIKVEISNFFDKNEDEEMASEQIYLLVNDKTVVDNVDKLKAAMQKQKVQIVLYGTHTKGDVWSQLSEGEQLIHVLDNDDKSINVTVQSVKRQSCIDKETSSIPTTTSHDDKSQKKTDYSYFILSVLNTIWLIGVTILLIYMWKTMRRLLLATEASSSEHPGAVEKGRRFAIKDDIPDDNVPRGVPPSEDPMDSVHFRMIGNEQP